MIGMLGGMAGLGVEVIVPPADQRAFVHRVIYEEVCLGALEERPPQPR